ncbi:MAG: ATP phosphoribosyltransferase regulatory subunit [Oscillospiraceae bacterium]|nr:ATP phosphoribosyltransferase regulatory subunit [Oscillospiraceae bacterium]
MDVLKYEEKAIFSLRALYQTYGYAQYKMSKFEEYDLYVRNKNFLVSDHIITFTDTDGKLMALKPDVTLSIIKNSKDITDSVQKVYYNENVYRVSKGTHSFKEIMQVGLECLGAVDSYCIFEVLKLACESLALISSDFVLDLSNLDIIAEVIDSLGVSDQARKNLLTCVGEKNLHSISAICAEEGVDGSRLRRLVSTYGVPAEVLPVLHEIVPESPAVAQLETVLQALAHSGADANVRIDFSVVGDMNYYNGFVFKGFISGVASGVLSGGQYDNLMDKMGRKSRAIGFAVYLDLLEQLCETDREYDVDAVILYDDGADLAALFDAHKLLTSSGMRVTVQKSLPEKLRYKQLLKLQERGVEIIENHA